MRNTGIPVQIAACCASNSVATEFMASMNMIRTVAVPYAFSIDIPFVRHEKDVHCERPGRFLQRTEEAQGPAPCSKQYRSCFTYSSTRASTIPFKIPGRAEGITTLNTVSSLVAPRARLPSLQEGGTALSDSSAVFTMVGSTIRASIVLRK